MKGRQLWWQVMQKQMDQEKQSGVDWTSENSAEKQVRPGKVGFGVIYACVQSLCEMSVQLSANK